MFIYALMFRFFAVICACSLFPIPCSLTRCEAKDFTSGPFTVSLSDKWTVADSPALPELMEATLSTAPTATLTVWKFNPGRNMTPDQLLGVLHTDWRWTEVSAQTADDPRFGRTNTGIYKKTGAFSELPLKIRSYDFVLAGDIYILVMSSPESQFAAADADFRDVFAGLSGGRTGEELEKGWRRAGEEMQSSPDFSQSSPNLLPPPPPMSSTPSPSLLPSSPAFSRYTFLYELANGSRLGFDIAKKEVSILSADGAVRSSFHISGTPYLSPKGIFVLSDEYAYQIDPSTGNVISRLAIKDVLSGMSSARPELPPTPVLPSLSSVPSIQPAPVEVYNPKSEIPTPRSQLEGDPVKAAIKQAEDIRRTKGVKPAIDYMTGQRPMAEQAGSPHLYEFYFRLGEYWEETGDLETALAYYRLATRAID